ncbi:MAG TPA: hypothetical protein VJ879_13025 [Desulfobacter sp.]|nr:hypothetical protein [Desulfobacter sp.]
MNKKAIPAGLVLLTVLFVISSCSTRGVHDKYSGATEQRLVTHSLDKLVSMLPENDFMPFKAQKIYVECHFLEKKTPLAYALKRIEMEFIQKYGCTVVDSPESADVIYDFFFTALGTDQDHLGFSTPELILPGVGSVSIDLIALDMYHGVSELYYYITEPDVGKVSRGDRIRSIIRTDKLALPIISIPISTLK